MNGPEDTAPLERLDVRRMRDSDAEAVQALADVVIGPGYFPAVEVRRTLERSTVGGVACSHVAVDGDRLVGFRFALPPGRWRKGRGDGLSPELWPAPREACAYFQSSYVALDHLGRGIGPRMAALAIADLRELGARAIVTHSWKESPHNSSFRYLSRLGFRPVTEHPEYWVNVDYVCRLDGKPCRCTAIEMVLELAPT